MKIIKIEKETNLYVETKEDSYLRFSNDSWFISMGESYEPIYGCKK